MLCSEPTDGSWEYSIDIFAAKYRYFLLFFYVRLWFGRADNLFYVEGNLIKISRVCWKHFLVFFKSSIQADYEYECELVMATSLINIVCICKVWQVIFRVFIDVFEDFFVQIYRTSGRRKRFLWILMAPCESTSWNYPKTVETTNFFTT